MYKILTICIVLLLGGTIQAMAASPEDLTLPQLEQRLAEIDFGLEQLANYTLRGGTGAAGYRSQLHQEPDAMEWICIELDSEVVVDQVVLVPTLFRAPQAGLLAEGFPHAFRILASTGQTTNVVASFSIEDHLLPRIAPLAVPFNPVKASWITIEATSLSPRIMDAQYMLQLSEIMVFSGMENVALCKNVQVSSLGNGTWDRQFLTDGFTPFLMDSAQGVRSQTKLIRVNNPHPPPTLTVDLNNTYPVNQINLHSANVALSIPMIRYNGWAVPRHVRVTGATRSDFADETVLCEYRQQSVYDTGPIIMRHFPETRCRYIRIEILDPHPVVSLDPNSTDIAISEIEVLSKNQNIAKDAPVTASSGLSAPKDTLLRMTDGLNYYGTILPIRDWMNQLSRRHDLETERPLVIAELNARYARQKTNLQWMSWLAALLFVGVGFAILIERFVHLRQLTRIKERLAADLHDELGANLHTIGLLGDLAQAAVNSPEKLTNLHQRIRVMTERSGVAVREFANILDAEGLYGDLIQDMQRATERIVAHIEGRFTFEGEKKLLQLSPRVRVDLFLFYKECLVNISRHSGATKFSTHLSASSREVRLVVSDNGHGISESKCNAGIPSSLQRRARLLKAKLQTESPTEGGTQIVLVLRTKRGKYKHSPLLEENS